MEGASSSTTELTVDFTGLKQRKAIDDVLVACFPDGPPPPRLLSASDSGLALALERHARYPRERRRVVAQGGGARYEGVNWGEGESRQPAKFAVGVYDKATATLRLVPLRHKFSLRNTAKPRVGADEQAAEEEAESYAEKRQKLTATYGSVKRQNQLKASKQNALSAANILSEADGGSSIEAAVRKSAEQNALQKAGAARRAGVGADASSQTARKLLPRHVLAASTAEEAYPLDGLVPAELRQHIESGVERWVAALSAGTEKEGKFVRQQLAVSGDGSGGTEIGGLLDEGERHERHLQLFMVRTLVKLLSIKGRELTSRETLEEKLGFSGIAAERYARKFVLKAKSAEGGTRSELKRDMALLHLLTLCLRVTDFRLDSSAIAQDVRLTGTRLLLYLKELGCTLKKDKTLGVFVASLSVPITFPQAKQEIRARKS